MRYEYSTLSANLSVEAVTCTITLAAVIGNRRRDGLSSDNAIAAPMTEIVLYTVPAALYLAKNLMQYSIFLYLDPPSYQILKNLNIISTGLLYRLFLGKSLGRLQWSALYLLAVGCAVTQLSNDSDVVFDTPSTGLLMAVIMALLSGAAGVYTELVMKKRPHRDVNVQNLYLYFFGIMFNLLAMTYHDGPQSLLHTNFFKGYNVIVYVMILNHALSGIAVSMVMKYADNIVKVYATSVAMILTTAVSIIFFNFRLSMAFLLGTSVVCVAVFLNQSSKTFER